MNGLVEYKYFPYLTVNKKKVDKANYLKQNLPDTREESFLLIGKYGVYKLNLLSYNEEGELPD